MVSITIGIVLTAITVAIHVAGTIVWAIRIRTKFRELDVAEAWSATLPIHSTLSIFSWTAAALILMHVVEVVIWGTAYYFLPDVLPTKTYEDAVYFSMVTFTSLGFGDVVIEAPKWRLLSGIQAMAGALVFGWSSALLFTGLVRLTEHAISGQK